MATCQRVVMLASGRVVADDELPDIDLVLCGSVAVNLKGARIGKGGGFSDIEYGLLIEAGKIDHHTVVATTVHPIQILRENLPVIAHDLPVAPDNVGPKTMPSYANVANGAVRTLKGGAKTFVGPVDDPFFVDLGSVFDGINIDKPGRPAIGLGNQGGGKDDVSSPPACRQMIDGARGRSALTRIVVYPGAYHDFDRTNLPVHAVSGGSDAALPEHGHLGSDPDARADSQKLVAQWLAR